MKKTLFLLLILTTLLSSAYGFDIVKNGKPQAQIVIDKKANENIKYAAETLQKYVKEASGATLTIDNISATKNNIYIYTKKDTGNDTVNLKVYKGDLYIVGNNDRATIYSVYELLEKYMGVRFFTPDNELVPENKNIKVPNKLKYSYTCPLLVRDTDFAHVQRNEFGVKSRLNGIYQDGKKYGGAYIYAKHYFCHSFYRYLPPEKYGADHPDFYVLKDGVRLNSGDTQLCMSNPEMRKELVKQVLKTLDEAEDKYLVDISQNDNREVCECEKCQELTKKYGNYSGVLLECINYVADEVAKKYPNTIVETLAYHQTKEAPINIKARPNVAIRLCNIECNFSEPLEWADKNAPYTRLGDIDKPYKSGEENKAFCENIVKWSKICNKLFIWDYVVNFLNYHMVHPNFQVLQPNMQYFIKNNVIAVFEEGDRDNHNATFDQLRTYIICKLMWNPKANVEELTKEFCDNVYGDGSENVMEVIDIFTKVITAKPNYLHTYSNNMNWMPNDEMIKSIKLLQDAMEKTKDNKKVYEKLETLYLDYLVGWYTKPDEDAEIIKNECNLPWSKVDYFEYLRDYSMEHKNPYYTETLPFDLTLKAKDFIRDGEPIDICKGLKDNEWFEINDVELGVVTKTGSMVKEDKTSPNQKSAYLKCDGDWDTFADIVGNIAKDRKEGWKGYDVYALCKCVNRTKNEGEGLRVGVYDYNIKDRLLRNNCQLSDIGDDWTLIKFGHFDFNKCSNAFLYLVAIKNPNCEYIAVDKVVFVKTK